MAFANWLSKNETNPSELSELAILIIDIDHFKKINDTHGHMAGDKALKQVTQSIIKNIRKSDHVYRIGGEEFLVTLQNTSIHEAETIC